MKRGNMKRMCLRSLVSSALAAALVSALLFVPIEAGARNRPLYGGAAEIGLREPFFEFEPASQHMSPELRNQVLPLVFESLTRMDEHGQAQPLLASKFTRVHSTRWAFTLRDDAQFSDGTPVEPKVVAEVLTPLLPNAKVRVQDRATVIIDTPASWENLPAILSLPRFAIYKQVENSDAIGSGPYSVSSFDRGSRLLLKRNTQYWGSAPYLDSIELRVATNGTSALAPTRSGFDVLQVPLEQARNVNPQSAVRSGMPLDLYALVSSRKNIVDERLRNALALSIERNSLAAMFGKESAKPAYSYLPQEVSGYAFLFTSAPDTAAARSLVNDSGRKAPVALAYAANDAVARSIAERVAVNARDAGLTLQPYGDRDPETALNGTASMAIIRLSIAGESPAVALYDVADRLGLDVDALMNAGDAAQLLDAERGLVFDRSAFPLIFVPSSTWIGARIRDVSEGAFWQLESAWRSGEPR
jgi:ABC-type transport system substrate-binding protein